MGSVVDIAIFPNTNNSRASIGNFHQFQLAYLEIRKQLQECRTKLPYMDGCFGVVFRWSQGESGGYFYIDNALCFQIHYDTNFS